MSHPIHPILFGSKAVFARSLGSFQVNPGCVVFNAPRPLIGTELRRNDWCHGRFYVEVNLSDWIASEFVKRNNELDARVVLPVSDEEVVEMLLIDNKDRERYRNLAFKDRLEMLLPKLSRIQNLPYGDAVALLDAAKAVLSADSAGSNTSLELPAGFVAETTLKLFLTFHEVDIELKFSGTVAEAYALSGQTIDVYQDGSGGITLTPAANDEAEQALVAGICYQMRFVTNGESINLGFFKDPHDMVRSATKLKVKLAA